MKKKLILLSIIIFPSLIYFMFELTQANFKKMPYFGPKSVNAKGDTVYWSVPDFFSFSKCVSDIEWEKTPDDSIEVKTAMECNEFNIDTIQYPVYCILFLDKNLRKEGYKLNGLMDYVKYKSKDLKDVPIFFISLVNPENERPLKLQTAKGLNMNGDFDSIPAHLANFLPGRLTAHDLSKFLSETYFKQKPVHVFDYFMVLVDKKRHIRGYYDPSYNAEVKRMIDEYKHLKIRDEYAETLKQNDIKQDK